MRIEVGWKRLSVGGVGFYAVGCRKLKRQHLPRGSYPTPVLGRLLLKITDPNHKTRYLKKGVGYEPRGRV